MSGASRLRLILASCVVVASACGSDAARAREPSQVDLRATVEHLSGRADMGDRLLPYASFEEILPNVSYRYDDEEPFRFSESLLVGEVVGAAPGRGRKQAADERESPDGVVTEFRDPAAVSRTLHLEVAVHRVLAGPELPRKVVRVGLAIGANVDPDVVVRGLRALGTIALPLTKSSPVFSYDTDLYSIVQDGALVVSVGEDGTLDLPFKPGAEGREFLGNLQTLDDLQNSAASPARELRFETVGGAPRRIG